MKQCVSMTKVSSYFIPVTFTINFAMNNLETLTTD